MANVRLVLAPSVKVAVKAARDKNHPEEACGLLFGHVIGPNAGGHVSFVAETFIECENMLHSTSGFEIDPVEYYKHLTAHAGRTLVGIVHTHPGVQFVSPRDRRYMLGTATLASTCWVIAGSALDRDGIDIGAYIVDGGTIVPVPVACVDA